MLRSGINEDHTASYFSHENAEATRLRYQLASDSLEMLIQWLKDGGNVGVHGEAIHGYPISILRSGQTPRIALKSGGLFPLPSHILFRCPRPLQSLH
jgi:hypothetical protein